MVVQCAPTLTAAVAREHGTAQNVREAHAVDSMNARWRWWRERCPALRLAHETQGLVPDSTWRTGCSHGFTLMPSVRILLVHWLRQLLGALLAFGALNAFGGGYYGLSGAKDVPKQWLEGSPFTDYFIPSAVLFGVVGGAFLIAAIAVFARWQTARSLALAAGVIVLGWLAVQVAIIGYVSWMQPTTAVAAVLIVVLAWQLPAADAPARWQRGALR